MRDPLSPLGLRGLRAPPGPQPMRVNVNWNTGPLAARTTYVMPDDTLGAEFVSTFVPEAPRPAPKRGWWQRIREAIRMVFAR